jgi:hypothetical protein
VKPKRIGMMRAYFHRDLAYNLAGLTYIGMEMSYKRRSRHGVWNMIVVESLIREKQSRQRRWRQLEQRSLRQRNLGLLVDSRPPTDTR